MTGIYLKPIPSVEEIEKYYRFDQETGLFYDRRTGEPGCVEREGGAGYRYLNFPRPVRGLSAHRVAWKLLTGRDPRGFIDHINGIRSDNRPLNLRDVSFRENVLNRHPGLWRATLEARASKAKCEEEIRLARLDARRHERKLRRYAAVQGALSFGA